MRYSDVPAMDAVYALVAELAEPENPEHARPGEAMVIAYALVELGEDRSWASVWWAYGALHHEMSAEALDTALEFLDRVDHPAEARAAALMLRAEIKDAQAALCTVGSVAYRAADAVGPSGVAGSRLARAPIAASSGEQGRRRRARRSQPRRRSA